MTKTRPAAIASLPEGCALSLRTHPRNPNHHLWWNNGTWWLHATVHRPDYTKQRLRLPLETKNIHQARAHRDTVLEAWSQGQRAGSRERGVKSPKKRQIARLVAAATYLAKPRFSSLQAEAA